jgi:hypothetical protein
VSTTATSGATTSPAPATYDHTIGQTVTITATSTAGYIFDYWPISNDDQSSIIIALCGNLEERTFRRISLPVALFKHSDSKHRSGDYA